MPPGRRLRRAGGICLAVLRARSGGGSCLRRLAEPGARGLHRRCSM
jgi:hypothetical protein